MRAVESFPTHQLSDRARVITTCELATYMRRTEASQRATRRARTVMPLGVPSSFQAYDPHPLVVRRAQQAWMEDVDGNRYVDFDMGFGALFAGHLHPAVRAAIEAQLDDGTLFVTPCEADADVAELLRDRYRLPLWRFTNSGTEATMDAIRVARGVTGRDKIVKVEGGYHGHHDEVMISMKPPLDAAGPADVPGRSRPPPASPRRSSATPGSCPTTTSPRWSGRSPAADVACFIVEPVMENIGICLPDPGYLAGVRELTRRPRHAARVRRGQDGDHRRLVGGERCPRRAARPRRARQEHRWRAADRRVRGQRRVHGPDHRRRACSTSAPTTATRCASPRPCRARRGLHPGGDAGGHRPQRPAAGRLCDHHRARRAARGRRAVRGQGLRHLVRAARPQLPRLQVDRLRPRIRAVDARDQPACCSRRDSTSSG